MCAQQSDYYRRKTAVKDDGVFNFREVFIKYIYHWPLFIIFIGLSLFVAYLYQRANVPIREIRASLVMQDSKDKTTADKSALQELEVSSAPKVVENEMEVLKSRNLISKTVLGLKLWISYQGASGGLKKQDLYKTSPVTFELIKANGDLGSQKFQILIKDANTFLLNGVDGKSKQFDFKDVLVNSFGTWKLTPNNNINNFIGDKIQITVRDPGKVTDDYQKALSVSLIDKMASTISLSLMDNVPQRGKDFLNHLISYYKQNEVIERNNVTQSTLDFIDKRLSSLTGELSHAEGQVQDFRSSRGLTDIDKQSSTYLQNVQSNDSHLNEVNLQLGVIEEIENYVESQKNSSVPSTLGITDPALNSLIEKLSQLQAERERLLATTPETNPAFDPINRQIKSTRQAIKDNISNIKASLMTQKKQLLSFDSKFQSSIKSIPGEERQFIGLKRDQTLKENLYTYLLQKREEVSLSYASTLTDARLVDSAYVIPIDPTKQMIPFGVAFMAGLIIPIVLIYGRTSIRNKITSSKDISSVLDVPILSELTYEKSKTAIVVHDRGKFAIAEEFRTMRTKLHYLHGKREKGRVTLLTSSISGEGKSFVATNLAVAMAASGRKTIILELDLRKPRVLVSLGVEGKVSGISNYLNGEVFEKQIIQHSDTYANLDIMGSGDFYSNPSELIDQPRMEALVNWLRLNYDDIIIDTPPVNIVTDAIILSRLADVTLYVIRQGHTSKVLLPFIKQLEEDNHFPKLNIIFNGIESGRYGYTGYGYGYEEYFDDKTNKKKYSKSVFKDFAKRF